MKKIVLLLFIGLTSWSAIVKAQDRMFNYVYQSLVLNKGQKEIETWVTPKLGKSDFYRALNTRVEFEVGLGKRLQTAFYLNYSSSVTEEPTDSMVTLSKGDELSFSNEWKYKLSDPVANAIGSALYGEITFSPTELELEFKLILDKKIGRFTQAMNLVFEPEWEWEAEENEVERETKYKFELNYGVGVDLGKGWSVGAELRIPNVAMEGEWAHSAMYMGPVVSYSRNDFWVNFTLLPQVVGFKGTTPGSSRNLDEFEKMQARLIFSFAI